MFGDIIEIERAKRSIGNVTTGVSAAADVAQRARIMRNDGSAGRTTPPLARLVWSVREKLAGFRHWARST